MEIINEEEVFDNDECAVVNFGSALDLNPGNAKNDD